MGEMKSRNGNIFFIRQCFITASVALNIVGHGCVIGYAAILIPALREPGSHIHATPSQESWIASIVGFALIAGNFIITTLMDTVGRKKSHMLTILPIMTGWFMLLLVNSVAGLITARFLQGVAMGMLGPLGSIIIGEMTDPLNRGAFLTSVSLALTIGVLFSHALGTYFSWEQTALICSFATFSSLLLIIYTPESPSWLISKGRTEEGREVFRWLRGNDDAQEEELEHLILAQKSRKSSIVQENTTAKTNVKIFFRYVSEAYKKPEFYKPIFIMSLMYIMFQFAGINVLSSYTMDIIHDVVGNDANAKVLMVALDIERMICNFLAVFLVKMIKRRTLLFSNVAICILAYISKGTYVYAYHNDMLPFHSQWLPISLIGIYVFALTVGISSITFAISGEIFPLQYRGLGGGISVLALSMNFFISVKSFPVLKGAVGLTLTYYIYGAIVTFCASILWFMLPETKDRTLQDIEDEFRGKTSDRSTEEPLNSRALDLAMRRSSSQIIY